MIIIIYINITLATLHNPCLWYLTSYLTKLEFNHNVIKHTHY